MLLSVSMNRIHKERAMDRDLHTLINMMFIHIGFGGTIAYTVLALSNTGTYFADTCIPDVAVFGVLIAASFVLAIIGTVSIHCEQDNPGHLK